MYSQRIALLGLVAAALALPSAALAQDGTGLSVDIEMVRPQFSAGSGFGVDSTQTGGKGYWRVGTLIQYQNGPLRLVEFESIQGKVVSHRHVAQIGMSYSPSKRFSLRMNLPLNLQWGSEIPLLDADGFGVSDLQAGLRVIVGQWRFFGFGIYGDLLLPVGTVENYMGEARPRTDFGLLSSLSGKGVTFNTNLGFHIRQLVSTERDFDLGNELIFDNGLTYTFKGDRFSVTGEILTRLGLTDFLVGGAENSMEWVAGVQYRPKKFMQLDIGVGKGMIQGYGTTVFRGMVGITFNYVAKPKVELEPEIEIIVADLIDEPTIEVDDTPTAPPEQWRQNELARVVDKEIVIRDPIGFEFGNPNILPESLPTLAAVAALLNANGIIGHLLIEGHASREGDYEYNFDLSNLRAKAIFKELIKDGVHPNRMSYRGMGEVVPRDSGDLEENLKTNRRVEFHIIRQYKMHEAVPDHGTEIIRPWDGEAATVTQPYVPPRVAKPTVKQITDLLDDADPGALKELSEPPPSPKPPPDDFELAPSAPAPPTAVSLPGDPATDTPTSVVLPPPAQPAAPAEEPPPVFTPANPAPSADTEDSGASNAQDGQEEVPVFTPAGGNDSSSEAEQ